jgi:hypothetical protein
MASEKNPVRFITNNYPMTSEILMRDLNGLHVIFQHSPLNDLFKLWANKAMFVALVLEPEE